MDALSETRLRAAEAVYADVAAFVGRRARVRTLEAQLATDASNLSVAELAECFPQSFEVFVPKGGKDEWVRALDLRPTERPVQAWRMGARQAGRTGLRRVAVGPKIPAKRRR